MKTLFLLTIMELFSQPKTPRSLASVSLLDAVSKNVLSFHHHPRWPARCQQNRSRHGDALGHRRERPRQALGSQHYLLALAERGAPIDSSSIVH